jgi:hypothetical protein
MILFYHKIRRISVMLALSALISTTAYGVEVYPLINDPNDDGPGFGGTDLFADPPAFFVDDTAVVNGNNIAVYTMDGIPTFNGAGFVVQVSNGENGIDATDFGNNTDIPNAAAVNSAIRTVNGGNKLQNGNAVRFSVWMRQAPNDPVVAVPQIEPVLKVELWKEALSSFAHYDAVPFPGFGDRIWDTDQNAGNSTFNGFNQSQASWVDMNNSGTTSFGKPVSQSLVTGEWRLVQTTLVIDDDPLNDGFGWLIGGDQFTAADIEEIRGVLYFGDFLNTNLTNAGSIWVDNILMEIFPDVTAMNSTPNPNPIPTEGLRGDFNGNGLYECTDINTLVADIAAGSNTAGYDLTGDNLVNLADLAEWRTVAGAVLSPMGGPIPPGDANLSGSVDGSDFGLWNSNKFTSVAAWCSGDFNADGSVDGSDFGIWNANKFTSADAGTVVPEPSAMASVVLGTAAWLLCSCRKI